MLVLHICRGAKINFTVLGMFTDSFGVCPFIAWGELVFIVPGGGDGGGGGSLFLACFQGRFLFVGFAHLQGKEIYIFCYHTKVKSTLTFSPHCADGRFNRMLVFRTRLSTSVIVGKRLCG